MSEESGETVDLTVDECIEDLVAAGYFGFEMQGEFDASGGGTSLYVWKKGARVEGRTFFGITAVEAYRKAADALAPIGRIEES